MAETLIEDPVAAPNHPALPNYNVAPTVQVPAIRHHQPDGDNDAVRHLDVFRWGLIPSWAKSKSIGAKMINARSETVATKNAFRAAAKRRRCIIPADAFYEWTAVTNPAGGKALKQPWCIRRTDGDPFAFAGLFEVWKDPDSAEADARVFSCSVLTRGANEAMSKIHDRMPVMVAPHLWDDWLDRSNEDIAGLLQVLEPMPSELIEIYPVSTAVNNSRSRGAELLNRSVPLEEQFAADASDQRISDQGISSRATGGQGSLL